MTFWVSVSASGAGGAAAVVPSAITPGASFGGGGAASVFAGVAGFGRAAGASSDARMREMGGKTSRFVLASRLLSSCAVFSCRSGIRSQLRDARLEQFAERLLSTTARQQSLAFSSGPWMPVRSLACGQQQSCARPACAPQFCCLSSLPLLFF